MRPRRPEPHPIACIEPRPTSQSIRLRGQFINLTAISKKTGISLSHLSRIMSIQNECSLKYARKIADALGMGVGGFVDAMQERKVEIILEYIDRGETRKLEEAEEAAA